MVNYLVSVCCEDYTKIGLPSPLNTYFTGESKSEEIFWGQLEQVIMLTTYSIHPSVCLSHLFTGLPTHSVLGHTSDSLWHLSSSSVVIVCRLSSFVTLHGGPVLLRPVRATYCFNLNRACGKYSKSLTRGQHAMQSVYISVRALKGTQRSDPRLWKLSLIQPLSDFCRKGHCPLYTLWL